MEPDRKPNFKNLHPHANLITTAYRLNTPPPTEQLPFIVSCPHAGLYTPPDFKKTICTPLQNILVRGDKFTDWLTDTAPTHGATHLICHTAPAYLNVGRANTSISSQDVPGSLTQLAHNNQDKYVNNGQGQGLVACRTLYGNQPIYPQGQNPDETEIKHRLDTYYDPFHNALQTEVNRHINTSDYCLIFDIHSCPSIGQAKDIDTDTTRPDIILSNADHQSCPRALLEELKDITEKAGFSVALNHPYKGGFITQKFSAHASPKTESLQIEFNRKSMGLNEETLLIEDEKRFKNMHNLTDLLLKHLAHYVKHK